MVTNTNMNMEYMGLSTDSKPTDGVPNGSSFIEIDTGDVYLYDASDNGSGWTKQFSLQG